MLSYVMKIKIQYPIYQLGPWLIKPRALQMQNISNSTSANCSNNNTSTFQIPPLISLHFEELKREMGQFGNSFTDWVSEKRKILTDEKENYLKTLAEEAGNLIIISTYPL